MTQAVSHETERSTTSQEKLRVLAVTSFRPEEITTSVERMEVPTEVITVVPSTGRIGHVLELYQQVQEALSTHDPDVILLDCYETMGIVVSLLASRHDIPVVARLVGDTWRGYEQPTLSEIEGIDDLQRYILHRASLHLDRYIFGRAAGFVTVSDELKTIVASRTGCLPERIGVVPVPMTVDILREGSATAGRAFHSIGEERIILTVTNLKFPEKFEGVKFALAELKPLLEADTDVGYVVAGSGRFLERLEATVDELFPDERVRERVYTPGHVENVADLYALADVFVYVSYRDGYPNAVLEAQTATLPVVANAAHGMCDQITDGKTGYLVDPGTPGQLRTRVASLLESPSERRQIGERARERVLQENTGEVIGTQLEEALRRILATQQQQ